MELVTLWMGIGFLFDVFSNRKRFCTNSWYIQLSNNESKLEGDVGRRSSVYYGIMVWLVSVVTYRMVDLTKYHFKKYNGIVTLSCMLLLTRIGVPVSTSFLVLSAFDFLCGMCEIHDGICSRYLSAIIVVGYH